MLLYSWKKAGEKDRLILSSDTKYNQINFSKNHVSGNARKIGVTFIWWFTGESNEILTNNLVRISSTLQVMSDKGEEMQLEPLTFERCMSLIESK